MPKSKLFRTHVCASVLLSLSLARSRALSLARALSRIHTQVQADTTILHFKARADFQLDSLRKDLEKATAERKKGSFLSSFCFLSPEGFFVFNDFVEGPKCSWNIQSILFDNKPGTEENIIGRIRF